MKDIKLLPSVQVYAVSNLETVWFTQQQYRHDTQFSEGVVGGRGNQSRQAGDKLMSFADLSWQISVIHTATLTDWPTKLHIAGLAVNIRSIEASAATVTSS